MLNQHQDRSGRQYVAILMIALLTFPLAAQNQPASQQSAGAQSASQSASQSTSPTTSQSTPPTSPQATSQAAQEPPRPQLQARPVNPQDAMAPVQRTPSGAQIILPAGTKLPLVMQNAVTTRNAKPGDAVYFETVFPIVRDSKVIIPAGSYVYGEVVEAKRAGRVKGRAELYVRMNTLVLPNAYTVNFNAVPTGAGTGGNESVTKEGAVKGDSDKGTDVGTLAGTTLAGAGLGSAIGAAAGNVGAGLGMGLGLGAAAGIIAMLLSRGPEIDLPRGTTLDVELDRPLYLDAAQITFTDPGHASTLSGPPNRAPVRSSRFPF